MHRLSGITFLFVARHGRQGHDDRSADPSCAASGNPNYGLFTPPRDPYLQPGVNKYCETRKKMPYRCFLHPPSLSSLWDKGYLGKYSWANSLVHSLLLIANTKMFSTKSFLHVVFLLIISSVKVSISSFPCPRLDWFLFYCSDSSSRLFYMGRCRMRCFHTQHWRSSGFSSNGSIHSRYFHHSWR